MATPPGCLLFLVICAPFLAVEARNVESYSKLASADSCQYPDHVRCEGSDSCIFVLQLCDGHPDCMGGSDERPEICEGTVCPPGVATCPGIDDYCLPPSWVCDGQNDCPDASDEALCDCPEHLPFRCGEGTCLPAGQVCDTFRDCPDGEDEADCSQCGADEFQCSYRYDKCISNEWRCDGFDDCWDYSDEAGCPPPTCSPDDFQCGDRSCIARQWVCDGDPDCPDGFDEMDYLCATPPPSTEEAGVVVGGDGQGGNHVDGCPANHISCHDGTCILGSMRCDGIPNCANEEDEADCPGAVESCENAFACPHGGCIPMGYVCDGYMDCAGGSDEAPEICREWECGAGQVTCADGLVCIPDYWVCDEVPDCPDDSDEAGCPAEGGGGDGGQGENGTEGGVNPEEEEGAVGVVGEAQCSPDRFSCGSGECLEQTQLCDATPDCQDASDESETLCVVQCVMEEHRDMMLLANPDATYHDVTADDCKQACLTSPECRSVDFVNDEDLGETCYVNHFSHLSRPDSFFHNPDSGYLYMYKDCGLAPRLQARSMRRLARRKLRSWQ